MLFRCFEMAGCPTPNSMAICDWVSHTDSSDILTSKWIESLGWYNTISFSSILSPVTYWFLFISHLYYNSKKASITLSYTPVDIKSYYAISSNYAQRGYLICFRLVRLWVVYWGQRYGKKDMVVRLWRFFVILQAQP